MQDAKAAFDSATAALIQGKRNLANAGELLRELTGDTWDTLEKPGNDMPLAGPNPASPEDWVKLAMDQNARLTSSRLAAEITRANISVERGGHFPAVDFVVNRGHDESDGVAQRHEPRATPPDRQLRHRLRRAGHGADLLRRRHDLARAPGAVPATPRPASASSARRARPSARRATPTSA